MKTNKSLAKRIKRTKRGKFLIRRRTTQHLVARVSKRAAKQSGKYVGVSRGLVKNLKKVLPYG